MNVAPTPYPAYKESELAWLDAVPRDWEVKRAKYVFRPIDKRSVDGAEDLLTVSSERGVVPRSGANVTMFEAESYAGHKLCWPGDLVINSLWAWAGGLGFADRHGIVSTAYGVYRPRREGDVKYLNLALRSGVYRWELTVRSRGIWTSRLQLTDPAFFDMPIVLPPAKDQAAIVRYLDHIDSRIQRFIAAKERLIELLEEEKRAIIHRAVTRGVDPDVPFKSSGVGWLGKIPRDWTVRRLRFVATIKTGGRDTDDRVDDGPFPFYVRSQKVERIDSYSFNGEAVLTAGDGAGVGRVFHHHPGGPGEAHQRVYKFDRFRGISGRFLFEYMRANLAREVMQLSAKATVDSLRRPMLASFPVAIPPPAEQEAITRAIDLRCKGIEQAVDRTHLELDLVHEYRSRLISDVVTGKLDVRSAAQHLPTDPEADAPELDEQLEEAVA